MCDTHGMLARASGGSPPHEVTLDPGEALDQAIVVSPTGERAPRVFEGSSEPEDDGALDVLDLADAPPAAPVEAPRTSTRSMVVLEAPVAPDTPQPAAKPAAPARRSRRTPVRPEAEEVVGFSDAEKNDLTAQLKTEAGQLRSTRGKGRGGRSVVGMQNDAARRINDALPGSLRLAHLSLKGHKRDTTLTNLARSVIEVLGDDGFDVMPRFLNEIANRSR